MRQRDVGESLICYSMTSSQEKTVIPSISSQLCKLLSFANMSSARLCVIVDVKQVISRREGNSQNISTRKLDFVQYHWNFFKRVRTEHQTNEVCIIMTSQIQYRWKLRSSKTESLRSLRFILIWCKQMENDYGFISTKLTIKIELPDIRSEQLTTWTYRQSSISGFISSSRQRRVFISMIVIIAETPG